MEFPPIPSVPKKTLIKKKFSVQLILISVTEFFPHVCPSFLIFLRLNCHSLFFPLSYKFLTKELRKGKFSS